ncbi:MAG: tRNA threonylcarbamoyladenosine dehydratase [Clostridia bacterium]|nr:tRNA threonylcarbamoyladenosine dehydratase [Clostridia bacterium]
MDEQFSRTERILGEAGMERLRRARVIVFGIGGVGSYAAEALVRSGIGAIDLVDNDKVAVSNLNRQLFALYSTLGMDKVDAAKARLQDISRDCRITVHKMFYLPENAAEIDLSKYDYVLDCIDTVSAKIELITRANLAGVRIISCMGAGNKLDPTKFERTDISKTTVDPLARVIRQRLRKKGIHHLTVVCSTEEPRPAAEQGTGEWETKGNTGRPAPGSLAFVPSAAGLIMAGAVIEAISGISGT